jgi:hypothetical protein
LKTRPAPSPGSIVGQDVRSSHPEGIMQRVGSAGEGSAPRTVSIGVEDQPVQIQDVAGTHFYPEHSNFPWHVSVKDRRCRRQPARLHPSPRTKSLVKEAGDHIDH